MISLELSGLSFCFKNAIYSKTSEILALSFTLRSFNYSLSILISDEQHLPLQEHFVSLTSFWVFHFLFSSNASPIRALPSWRQEVR